MLAAVIPAAGASRRFGTDKLAFEVDGVAVLVRLLRALRAGGASPLIAVVDSSTGKRAALALAEGAELLENPDPSAGMLASIQLGLAAAPAGGLLVCPADLPFLAPGTVAAVLETAHKAPTELVVPVYGGRRGHPLAIPASLRPEVFHLDPTVGLRELLLHHPRRIREVVVTDPGCVRDLDRRTDLP